MKKIVTATEVIFRRPTPRLESASGVQIEASPAFPVPVPGVHVSFALVAANRPDIGGGGPPKARKQRILERQGRSRPGLTIPVGDNPNPGHPKIARSAPPHMARTGLEQAAIEG